jgi:hypothetical protein
MSRDSTVCKVTVLLAGHQRNVGSIPCIGRVRVCWFSPLHWQDMYLFSKVSRQVVYPLNLLFSAYKSYCAGVNGRGLKLTTYDHLVWRSRMSVVKPSLRHIPF